MNEHSCAAHQGAPSEEAGNVTADAGLTTADLAALDAGWVANQAAAQRYVLEHGGWNWQLFGYSQPPDPTRYTRGSTAQLPASNTSSQCTARRGCPANCTAYLRRECSSAPPSKVLPLRDQAMKYQLHTVEHSRPLTPEGHYPSFLVDLSAFLLVRGPFAWLGTDCE